MATTLKSARKDKKNKESASKESLKAHVFRQKPTSGSANIFDALNGEVGDEVDG